MSDGSRGLSLFTITFMTTLYAVLHKLMGLKEARQSALGHLRTRVIRVSFRCGGMAPFRKIELTSSNKEAPTICQYDWKRPTCKPTGLGLLKGFILHKLSLTSWIDTSKVRGANSFGSIQLGQVWISQIFLGAVRALEENNSLNPFLINIATSSSFSTLFP